MLNILIMIVIGAIGLGFMANRSKESLHMMQLEGYITSQYKRWLSDNKDRAYSLKKGTETAKKPLVFTERAKRLYTANILLNAIILGIIIFLYSVSFIDIEILLFIIALVFLIIAICILYYFQPLTILLSNEVMKPIEGNINMGFYRMAQEKVKNRPDLSVIGVTGSFGKTSTKFILGTILEEKFKVLNTPESYNTPMGLSKVINNNLQEDHEVFIAELGARNIGDIKEVSELVSPKIGVLTSIGSVHMETFKNIDNIMKTKYELIEELPTDGIAIFNYDNEHIKKLADKTFKEKILYGLEDIENLDIYAEDIEVSEMGSTFTIKDKEGNLAKCSTILLGKHNIYNILAGVAVAKSLGMSFDEIRKGIERIEPIPHRLNIINPGTGVIVIDDAFNSNPIGSKAALEVLGQFKEGRKIIVTPGMVELGTMEKEANKEFGIHIGKVCDYVILVGEKRTLPIYEGLMEVNYTKENIFVVKNLDEASTYIQKIARPKDIILFENDLPDNYNEV